MSHRATFLVFIIGFFSIASAITRAQTAANLEANFAPSLTITYNTAGTVVALRNGGEQLSNKFVSFTVGARDILFDLIERDQIPGPLTGWKLIARATTSEAPFLRYRLFAVKAGQSEYPLDSDDFNSLDLTPSFIISQVKEVEHLDGHYTGSGVIRFYVSGQYAFLDFDLYVAGNTTTPYSYKVLTIDGTKLSVTLPGTVEAKVSGGETFPDKNDASVVTAGSLKFSGHRILSLID